MVEVLIAGAGPAGSAAAIVLARAGVRVLLVDRARFPRPKLCGDTLNPGALALLETLGLRHVVEPLGIPLDGMRVTSKTGFGVTADYQGSHALAITRDVLDHALLEAAAAAGAHIEEGVQVVAPLLDGANGGPMVRGAVLRTANGGRVRVPSAWTIAADGRRSTLALALRLIAHPARPRRWAVGAYYTGVDALSPFGEMHIRPGHYIGVAPLAGGLANACVVTDDRQKLSRPTELLEETVRRDPLLRDRFACASRASAVTSVGPLAVDCRSCGVDGMLLAGDAAGFIDPMTGDGLRLAIRGGTLAAEAILRAIDRSPIAPQQWLASARRREFAGKLRLNRLLRHVVGAPAAIATGELSAHVLPGLVRWLIRAAGDLPGRVSSEYT